MPGAEIQTYRVLRRPEVLELTGLSAATVYRWIAEGLFPPPVRLGPNSVGWRWSELQDWLESRELAVSANGSRPDQHAEAGGDPVSPATEPDP